MTFSPWLQSWQSPSKQLSGQGRVFSSPNLKSQPHTLLFLGRVEPALPPSPGCCQRGRFSAALSGLGGHSLAWRRVRLFVLHVPQAWAGCGDPTRLLSIRLLLQGRPNSRFRTVLRRAVRELHHPAGHPALNSILLLSAVHLTQADAVWRGKHPFLSLPRKGVGGDSRMSSLPSGYAPAWPRPVPAQSLPPRPPIPGSAARGGGCGSGLIVTARLLWGRSSPTEWGRREARGWESGRRRRAAPEEGGARWLIPLEDQTRSPSSPAPPLLNREAPARPHRPPAPSSRPGRGAESFPGLTACGKRSGHGWEAVAARARRVHGVGRPGRASGGPGAGPGWAQLLSLCPAAPRSRLPLGPLRGSRSSAMSRLLPLLGSRTARSLRPGPAAAPRLPSWCCCGRGLLALGVPGGPRLLGTHPKKEPMEALNTAQGARDFIYSLHSTERSCLLKELHRFESIAIAQGKRVGPPGKTYFSDPCRLPTLCPAPGTAERGNFPPSECPQDRTRADRAR